jgi:hypothetical protein
LSDALAIEKVKEALILDGYDLTNWQPCAARSSVAPDGSSDVYLVRNANPNRGHIVFDLRSDEPQPYLAVEIELTGGQVRCQVVRCKWRL